MEKIKKYFTERDIVLLEYNNSTNYVEVKMPIKENLKLMLEREEFTVVEFWDINVTEVIVLINAFKFHNVCELEIVNDVATNIMNDEYRSLSELIETLKIFSENKYLDLDESLLQVKQHYDSIHIVKGNKLQDEKFDWLIELLEQQGKLGKKDIVHFANGDIKLCIALKGNNISYNLIWNTEEIKDLEFNFENDNIDEFIEGTSVEDFLELLGLDYLYGTWI